jgi:O-antigen ligase
MVGERHGRSALVISEWLDTDTTARSGRVWGLRLIQAGLLIACLGACVSPPLLNIGLGLGVAGGLVARVPAHRLPGFWVASGLALWMLLCTAVNHAPTQRFDYPGWAYTWPALYVFAFAAADQRLRRWALFLLCLGGISAVALGVMQFWIGLDTGHPPLRVGSDGQQQTRAVGWFSHHIRFGIAMAQMSVVALAMDACGWSWRWRMIPVVLGMLGVALSSSRGALMALAGGVACTLAVRGRKWIVVGVVGSAVVVGLGIAASLVVQPDRATQALQGQDVRWQVWRTALLIIRDNPWCGVGPAGFDQAYTAVVTAGRSIITDPWALSPGNAHNQFLSLGTYYGMPGAILYAVWLFVVIRDLWRSRAAAGVWPLACGTVVVALVGGLTEDLANYATSRHGLFILLAIACGLAADGFRRKPT